MAMQNLSLMVLAWLSMNLFSVVNLPAQVAPPIATTQTEPADESTSRELFNRANELFRMGKYDDAGRAVDRLCQREPDVAGFQFLRGELAFATGQMNDSVAAFDEVIRLQPQSEPQLWQRGLALYYAERFADGVAQFETHQTVNSQDVENAVWHLLCAARISDLEQARRDLIPIQQDRRVPMAQIYEMFAGRQSREDVLNAAQQTSARVPKGSERHRLQLYYAYLYIGLFEEMLGNPQASLASMEKAKQVNPLPPDNFMGRVAPVHHRLRKSVDPNDQPK